jgi:septum formation topological specificity factor MinE
MSDRLPSGRTTKTKRTARRRMLLIAASDRLSKA